MQVWCGPALYEGDPTLPHMPWDRAAYLAPINTGGGTPAGGGGEVADFGLGSRSAHLRAAAGGGSGGGVGGGGGAGSGGAAGGGGAAAGGGRRLRFGVLRDDGWFAAAPALARALEETVQAARVRARRRPSPS